MKQKIVITGASGFVGKNLSNYLEQANCLIQSLSLRNDDWTNVIDLNAAAVIHLAGKAHDLKNTSDANAYFEVNYELTKKVYDSFLKSESEVFIYMSSVKAVKDVVEGVLTEEETPTPVTAYGQSKLKAEEYILMNMPSNKRVYILRPCMIHGPGNKGNLNLLYKVVKKGIPYPLAAYNNERSFLSIENLNYLLLQIINTKKVASGIYNLADDTFISTTDLIHIISNAIGTKSRLLKIPKTVVNALAKSGDFLKLPLNTERLNKLTENYRVSNEKIKEALGIVHLPISSAEGLSKTIKSFESK